MDVETDDGDAKPVSIPHSIADLRARLNLCTPSVQIVGIPYPWDGPVEDGPPVTACGCDKRIENRRRI